MTLGVWNRLAIVAAVLAIIIVPIGLMVLMFSDLSEGIRASYELCNRWATEGPVDLLDGTYKRCTDKMSLGYERAGDAAYSWSAWSSFALGTLIACAVIYALIWAAAATVRWVLRGRRMDA